MNVFCYHCTADDLIHFYWMSSVTSVSRMTWFTSTECLLLPVYGGWPDSLLLNVFCYQCTADDLIHFYWMSAVTSLRRMTWFTSTDCLLLPVYGGWSWFTSNECLMLPVYGGWPDSLLMNVFCYLCTADDLIHFYWMSSVTSVRWMTWFISTECLLLPV